MGTAARGAIREDAFPLSGTTPMVKVVLGVDGLLRPVSLKLESHNPTGSLKDRTAACLIQDLENRGRLSSSSVIIESTSGNLGVALAFLAQRRGYRFLAVTDPKTTTENARRILEFGAALEVVEKPDKNGGYLLERLRVVRKLCDESLHYVWPDQYSNPANPLSHYLTTGPEILRQMNGHVDALFVAVSTGGTLAGVARYFRRASPKTKIVAVDACGSIVFGGRPAPRKLTGIGSSRMSAFIRPEHYDAVVSVADHHAFAVCRQMRTRTGISLGGSSGAVLYACAHYVADHSEQENVVCLCADSGEAYVSTIFHDGWLQANGFDPQENAIDIEASYLNSLPGVAH